MESEILVVQGLVKIIIIFLIAMACSCATAQDRRTNPYKSEKVYQRRQRIVRNGNINNFYRRPINIQWVLINGRAEMVILFNRNQGG